MPPTHVGSFCIRTYQQLYTAPCRVSGNAPGSSASKTLTTRSAVFLMSKIISNGDNNHQRRERPDPRRIPPQRVGESKNQQCQPMAQRKESVLFQHLPVQRLTPYRAKGKHGHRCHVGRGGVRRTRTSGGSRGNGSSRMAHGSTKKTIKLTFNEKKTQTWK